jgi:malonate decarboxylase gamma subunit
MNTLLDRLFPAGHDVTIDGLNLAGTAHSATGPVHVIGTRDRAALTSDIALRLSQAVLSAVRDDLASGSARPIVFIASTQGQALSRHEELMCLNGYFAHLARCVDLARRHGHVLVTLIHGEAVSGGFLAFGLLADRICALPGAQVKVMDLRAMARVTKIAPERLEALAQTSPVFAPGAENYWRMGGIHDLWSDGDDWPAQLSRALTEADRSDHRAALGASRGGRTLARAVATRVVAGPTPDA